MPFLDILSQVCVTIGIINVALSLLFFKKYKTKLSKNFFLLVAVSFLNVFSPGATLYVINQFFPYISGYEYIYIIGFAVTVLAVILIMFVCRNLYFIGVEGEEKEKTRVFLIVLVYAALVIAAYAVFKDLDFMFDFLSYIIIGSGAVFLVIFAQALIRFIRIYDDIPSYVVRRAGLFLFILAGVLIPVLYASLILDYILYGSTVELRTFIYDTVNQYNRTHSLLFILPVLIYHLLFHGLCVFFVARYYFRSADRKYRQISPEEIENYNLSQREVEVANLIIRGLKNKVIRERLYIADGTLRNHISRIYQKFQVKSRKEFISFIVDK